MRLFIIGGKAKSGKTTFGNYLREELKKYGYKPCVMHLTEPLYGYARNYFDWNPDVDDKPREFLQKMGIEIIKEKLHKNYFLVDRLCEDISILENFFDTFIITDARLIMEFEELKKRYDNVTTIKLIRNADDIGLSQEEINHITEIELDDYNDFDYVIGNESLSELEKAVKTLVKEVESNEGDII